MKMFYGVAMSLWLTMACFAQAPAPTAKLPSQGTDMPWSVSAQYMKTTNDWGPNWHFNGAQFDVSRSLTPRWALDAEFDFSKANGHDATHIAYRLGPRFNIVTGHKVVPFAEFLVGGAHMHAVNTRYGGPGIFVGESTWTGFSFLTGGGVDVQFTQHFGVRGQAGVAMLPYGIHSTDRDFWPQYSVGAFVRF